MSVEFEFDDEKTNNFSNYLKKKSEELDGLYKDVLQLCDEIEKNYKSEDSSIYLSRFRNNIKKIAYENEDLYEGGLVLDKTTALYTQQENKWAKQVSLLEEDKEVIS